MLLNESRWKWAAPELQEPGDYGTEKIFATMPSDIYGMGMVIYEVSPCDMFTLRLCLICIQVLTRNVPFHERLDFTLLEEIRKGKRLQKPENAVSLRITDTIWTLLEECWNWNPNLRPDSLHLLSALRQECRFGDAGTAISTGLKLQMKDVAIKLTKKRSIDPYITLHYGSQTYTTSRATSGEGNKYIWYGVSLVLLSPPFHGISQERP